MYDTRCVHQFCLPIMDVESGHCSRRVETAQKGMSLTIFKCHEPDAFRAVQSSKQPFGENEGTQNSQ